jgi:UDP-2,4-diacetamido-2,4,6-trideoxy-beta-L-altropyranose hydrolase
MRCLALADMLAPAFGCRFVIHAPTSSLLALFEQKQVSVFSLHTADIAEFTAILTPADFVVLDGYQFDEAMQRAVRAACKKLIYIDDLLSVHQVADVVINHTAGIVPTDYSAEPYTHFLLGPTYALVNPSFKASIPTPTGPIFVNLGGADPLNITHQVVTRLVAIVPATQPIRVVLGGANPHRSSFTNLPQDRVTLLTNLSVSAMADELNKCALAIVSCSTIAYEVATIGRPFIGILSADNQRLLASFLQEHELAIGVLPIPLDLNRLALLVFQAGDNQGISQQRLYLDGRAAERYIAAFRHLLTSEN